MNTKRLVTTHPLDPDDLNTIQASAADQMTSTAKHALEGCIFGLTPNAAQDGVVPGEAYVSGNRLRLTEERSIDLSAITRPAAGMVAWVSVQANYATESVGTVTDEMGVQHVFQTNDGIVISLVRGVDAADQASAVKPDVPTGSIVLCDILLDENTAIGSLTGDPSRRPKCPDDELRDEDETQWEAIRAIQATLAAGLQAPNKGPTPTATSTVALRIDATWAAGTIPGGAPAIDKAKFRWRLAGENWTDARTLTLLNVQMTMFSVAGTDNDVEMQVQYGNSNGFGEWSDTGTFDAGDIEAPPALMDHEYTTPGSHTLNWPYPQATRARLTIVGADGGGGGGAGAGGNSVANSGAQGLGGAGGVGTGGAESGANGEDGGVRDSGDGGDGGGTDGGAGAISPSNAAARQSTSGGGGGGAQGEAGEESSVTADSISLSETADGGAGGNGGGGGAGADGIDSTHPGENGDDAGDGAGANGGAGGVTPGGVLDFSGGDGGAGGGGTTLIVDISGLVVGTPFTIQVGDGGAGGAAGSGGARPAGGIAAASGTSGSDGDVGSVTIQPLTE